MADLTGTLIIISTLGGLVSLILLIISCIKKDFKFKPKQILIVWGGCIVVFVISFYVFGITYKPTNATSKVKTETAASTSKEDEAKKKADEENEKYISLLESGKTYEVMTTQERTDISELLQTWDKQDQEFKNKYKSQKESIEKSKDEAVAKWKAEDEAKAAQVAAQKAEDEKVAYDTGITYEQLARTPDEYKGKKAKFSGKVIQVVEGKGETDLRIAVSGNYDTILYVVYDPKISSTRILENDSVIVKGISKGIYTYKTTLGGQKSIPLLMVDKIELNK